MTNYHSNAQANNFKSVSDWVNLTAQSQGGYHAYSFRSHSLGFQSGHIRACSDWVVYFSNFSEVWSFFLFFYTLSLCFFFYYILPEASARYRVSMNPTTPVSWVSGTIACGVPFVLIFSILYESVYMLYLNEVSTSKNSPLFLIEGKQWKWEYRYSLVALLEQSSALKLVGSCYETSSYKLPTNELKSLRCLYTDFLGGDFLENGLRVKSEILKASSENVNSTDLLRAASVGSPSTATPRREATAALYGVFTRFSVHGSMRRMVTATRAVTLPDAPTVRAHITSTDVIHSWTIPTMGVRIDAVPGKLYSIKLSFKHYGVFSGQCSEVCGLRHAYMPIAISVVPVSYFFKAQCAGVLGVAGSFFNKFSVKKLA